MTALDVSTIALGLASQNAEQAGVSITFVHGFAEHLPFPDNSFDFITSCHTLEHVKDLRKACAEFKRVAQKNRGARAQTTLQIVYGQLPYSILFQA